MQRNFSAATATDFLWFRRLSKGQDRNSNGVDGAVSMEQTLRR